MSNLEFEKLSPTGYDRAFAHVTAHFIPFLLRAGRLAPAQRVLDIATGTGLAAASALAAVGPAGHVTAADLSPEMVEQARARLNDAPNVSFAVEDGQALRFPDESFDVVLCSLGLMFFAAPARGLAEFRRVLRSDNRATAAHRFPAPSFDAYFEQFDRGWGRVGKRSSHFPTKRDRRCAMPFATTLETQAGRSKLR